MINMLAVTYDGRPVSSRAETTAEAFKRMAEWIEDEYWNEGKPLVRFFFGDKEYGVTEYTKSEVKAEAKRLNPRVTK